MARQQQQQLHRWRTPLGGAAVPAYQRRGAPLAFGFAGEDEADDGGGGGDGGDQEQRLEASLPPMQAHTQPASSQQQQTPLQTPHTPQQQHPVLPQQQSGARRLFFARARAGILAARAACGHALGFAALPSGATEAGAPEAVLEFLRATAVARAGGRAPTVVVYNDWAAAEACLARLRRAAAAAGAGADAEADSGGGSSGGGGGGGGAGGTVAARARALVDFFARTRFVCDTVSGVLCVCLKVGPLQRSPDLLTHC